MQQWCHGEDNARQGTNDSDIVYNIPSSICKNIITNDFLDAIFTSLYYSSIVFFEDSQSAIRQTQQEIQETRNLYEHTATLITSVSWQDQTEARQVSELVRSSHLEIQERELRVQELNLRLKEESMPILLSLEINRRNAMRSLTTYLREAITATSDRAAGS
jgi:hypothetical protein